MLLLIYILQFFAFIAIFFLATAYVAAWLALIIHELGHLIAAVLLKQPIKHVRLGCGRHTLVSKKILGARVTFRGYPFMGFRPPTNTCLQIHGEALGYWWPASVSFRCIPLHCFVQSHCGTIANFLAAFVTRLSTLSPQAVCLMFVFHLISFFTASALLNLLPFRFGKFASDG